MAFQETKYISFVSFIRKRIYLFPSFSNKGFVYMFPWIWLYIDLDSFDFSIHSSVHCEI